LQAYWLVLWRVHCDLATVEFHSGFADFLQMERTNEFLHGNAANWLSSIYTTNPTAMLHSTPDPSLTQPALADAVGPRWVNGQIESNSEGVVCKRVENIWGT
jgi:hypothetical protein